MKRMVLLIAALCMFASEAAAKCDEPTEAQQIAKFSDKVSRQGNELFFKLKDGTTVSRKSNRRDVPDCEGNGAVSYTFYDFVDPWYVISEGYYESSGTGFINRIPGKRQSSPEHPNCLPTSCASLRSDIGEKARVTNVGESLAQTSPENGSWVEAPIICDGRPVNCGHR